jgi:hypothetical protein
MGIAVRNGARDIGFVLLGVIWLAVWAARFG